jgi:flagellar biosynthesis/type III secretory pathway M-ring protein FliF/YscJ
MIRESFKLKIKIWWLLVVLTFMVALAFSFPLFLYLRERQLEKLSETTPLP